MINPDLMKLGLWHGATVALAEKGTAGAPCRSAVLSAGVEAVLAEMVVACPERGLKLERPPSASGTAQLHDIFASARVDEMEGRSGAVRFDDRRATGSLRSRTQARRQPPPHVAHCYHVENNTESGSLQFDNVKRDVDNRKQYRGIGGR